MVRLIEMQINYYTLNKILYIRAVFMYKCVCAYALGMLVRHVHVNSCCLISFNISLHLLLLENVSKKF